MGWCAGWLLSRDCERLHEVWLTSIHNLNPLFNAYHLFAGLTGLLLGAATLASGGAPPVAGLALLNPHVASALSHGWGRDGPAAMHIPRESAPVGSSGSLTGTSSFGMSGVNAHAILRGGGVCSGSNLLAGQAALPCVPAVAWPCPLLCSLMTGALPGAKKGSLHLAATPAAAKHAWLHDHVVAGERLGGRRLCIRCQAGDVRNGSTLRTCTTAQRHTPLCRQCVTLQPLLHPITQASAPCYLPPPSWSWR